VAFGVQDGERGTESLVIVAEVQPRSKAALQQLADEVRATVAEQIGLAPADVQLLLPGTLARTSSGKLMRRDARDRYVGGALDGKGALEPGLLVRVLGAARGAVLRYVARRRAAGR
jgi:acyl-CoA synthetase (AMP-forming)/AMP-acid ligase II